MISPFASHAVPFLWCRDDYLAALNTAQLHVIRVSRQLGAFEIQLRELGIPVSKAFTAKGFCGCLVDDFESFVFEDVEKSANRQFHYDCLAASRWCRNDCVVVAVVDGVERFRLDGIEEWEGEHCAVRLG